MKVTLEALEELVNANTPAICTIDTAYIDYGADWKERTLIAQTKDGNGTYQMICPRDINKLIDGTYTYEDAKKFISEINERGW